MPLFSSLFGTQEESGWKQSEPIIVVSGLPRSGTSMMMRMLEAGGQAVLIDGIRTADEDNPNGYYEFEKVKQLDKGDTKWLSEARGKAVKVISALLTSLPPDYHYKVLFMNRKIEEILASQRKMMTRHGKSDTISDAEMAQLLHKHVKQVKIWLNRQPNIETLELDYNAIIADPSPSIRQINRFLNGALNERMMLSAIDSALYRSRL